MALTMPGTSGGSGSGADPSITLPTHTTGDILYLCVAHKVVSRTMSAPSGYSNISGSPWALGEEGVIWVVRKVAGSSESAPAPTFSDNSDNHRWAMVSMRGADTTTPEQDVDESETTGWSGTTDFPSSDAGGNTVWSLIFLYGAQNNFEVSAWPSGWTEDLEVATGQRLYVAHNASPGTGTVNGGTITTVSGDDGQSSCIQILVKEAAAGTSVTPGVASLTLATFAPTVSTPVTVTPGVASLTLTGQAPTVTATANQSVTPGVGSLTLTGFAPTVTATANQSVTPGAASLTLTGLAPTVTAGGSVSLTPDTASLTLTGLAPTVTATANQSVTPGTASLTLTGLAPTVTATANQSVTPG